MILLRLWTFLSYLLKIAPFAIVAFLAITAFGNDQVQNFHLDSPAGLAVEPYVRWRREERYSAVAGSVLTVSIGLAWYLTKQKSRQIDRLLDGSTRRRRR